MKKKKEFDEEALNIIKKLIEDYYDHDPKQANLKHMIVINLKFFLFETYRMKTENLKKIIDFIIENIKEEDHLYLITNLFTGNLNSVYDYSEITPELYEYILKKISELSFKITSKKLLYQLFIIKPSINNFISNKKTENRKRKMLYIGSKYWRYFNLREALNKEAFYELIKTFIRFNIKFADHSYIQKEDLIRIFNQSLKSDYGTLYYDIFGLEGGICYDQ